MLAMADRAGRVWSSVPGLANRARIPLEDARIAIATFLAPDPDSRTSDHEGRRIEAIDGGWRLLNHEKYREIRDEESSLEAKRKYINARREKERLEKAGVLKDVDDVEKSRSGVGGCIDNAESDSESEGENKETSPSAHGFDEFWNIWPKTPRKGGKAECLKLWKQQKLEKHSIEILSHVKAMAASEDWMKQNGSFVPAPVVYLRGKRWDGAELTPIETGSNLMSGAI